MHKTLFIQFLALPALTVFTSLPFTRPYQHKVHSNMLPPRKRTVKEEGSPASVAAEVGGNTKKHKALPFNLPETMPGDGLVRTVTLPLASAEPGFSAPASLHGSSAPPWSAMDLFVANCCSKQNNDEMMDINGIHASMPS